MKIDTKIWTDWDRSIDQSILISWRRRSLFHFCFERRNTWEVSFFFRIIILSHENVFSQTPPCSSLYILSILPITATQQLSLFYKVASNSTYAKNLLTFCSSWQLYTWKSPGKWAMNVYKRISQFIVQSLLLGWKKWSRSLGKKRFAHVFV